MTPAPNMPPAGAANMPPAGIDQQSQAAEQMAAQYEAVAQQWDNQATVEKAKAKVNKSQNSVIKAKHDQQQAQMEAQQLRAELANPQPAPGAGAPGAPGAGPTAGPGMPSPAEMPKGAPTPGAPSPMGGAGAPSPSPSPMGGAGAGGPPPSPAGGSSLGAGKTPTPGETPQPGAAAMPKPGDAPAVPTPPKVATEKLASVKLRLLNAKHARNARIREFWGETSAVAEAVLDTISDEHVKSGSALDPIEDTSPMLVGWGLATGGSGKLIDMINQRQHGRARTEKVANLQEYVAVLHRGMTLDRGIRKMAATIEAAVTKVASEKQLSPVALAVKMAANKLNQNTRLKLHMKVSQVADREFRKYAATADKVKIAGREMPVGTIEQAFAAIEAAAPVLDTDKTANEAVRVVFAKHPEIRKAANIMALNRAGAAALVNNDTDTLAKAVYGLAVEGALGREAFAAATGK